MNKTILLLPSGTELSGGAAGDALVSLTLHQSVNSDTEYTVGSACADYIEAELWADPGGTLRITAGDELALYREDSDGARTQTGIYIAEKPTRTKRNTYKITAYDRMTLLDKSLSSWLYSNQSSFPMTLWALVQAVCSQCGVTLESTSLPDNGSYEVQAFYADDVTGRQIISWAAEAAGCYAHMTAAGTLEFARFTAGSVAVAPAAADGQAAYYADSLSYEDYTVKAIEKVRIRQSDSDVGVIYPDSTDALNTYVVQGNLLLTTGTEEALKGVAQTLYTALSGVTYTPCKFSVPANSGFAVGQTAAVTDVRGNSFTAYLFSATVNFSATVSGGKTTFECTGSASRDSSSAVNHQSYKNLRGRMLEIETSVDGLTVTASELSGNYSELKQTVDGITTEVTQTAKTAAEEAVGDKLAAYSTTEQMNAAITAKADEITSTVSKTYATTESVTLLVTGTDNMIQHAGDAEQWSTYSSKSYHTITKDGDTLTLVSTSSSSSYPFRIYFSIVDGCETVSNTTYCFSVWIKATSGTASLTPVFRYKKSGSSSVTALNMTGKTTVDGDDGWQRVYWTCTPSAGTLVNVWLTSTSVATIAFRHPMLQTGSTPTAWGPAESESPLGEYSTTTEVQSAIDQKADEITSTVTSTIKTEMAGNLPGGANMLLGTAKMSNAGVDSVADYSGGTDKLGTVTNDGAMCEIANAAQNTRLRFEQDSATAIKSGVTYCVSVMYKLVSGTDGLRLKVQYQPSSGTTATAEFAPDACTDIAQSDGWVLRYATFTAEQDGTTFWMYLPSCVDLGTVTNDYYLMHPMLQQGSTPTAWEPAAGDPESYTDNQLTNYSTTVDMQSAIDQKADSITSTVSATYSTKTELETKITQTETKITQTVESITLSASTSGTSSTLTLKAGSTTLSSAAISFSGVVTFTDLSTWNNDSYTMINGGNITTGQIHNTGYSTVYDLDAATIRMGTSDGQRVFIDNKHILWYGTLSDGSTIGLTGVCYSIAGSSFIGASSKYIYYGWLENENPTESTWNGMRIEYNTSSDTHADFNGALVGINNTLNVQNLSCWGTKSRVVSTSYGDLRMAAMEAPEPEFCDFGSGVCGADGLCLILHDPRYAETLEARKAARWLLTDTSGAGALWAEKRPDGALIHGAAGQTFDWQCMTAQRGYGQDYAEVNDTGRLRRENAGESWVNSLALAVQEENADAADALLSEDTGADELTDLLLEGEDAA